MAKALSNLDANLRREKVRRLSRVNSICQVCGGNNQSARAHKVSQRANHFCLALGVSWNLPAVLEIASEPKQNRTLDTLLYVGGESLDGIVDDGGSLAEYALDAANTPSIGSRWN
jgi:hypothetical protein